MAINFDLSELPAHVRHGMPYCFPCSKERQALVQCQEMQTGGDGFMRSYYVAVRCHGETEVIEIPTEVLALTHDPQSFRLDGWAFLPKCPVCQQPMGWEDFNRTALHACLKVDPQCLNCKSLEGAPVRRLTE